MLHSIKKILNIIAVNVKRALLIFVVFVFLWSLVSVSSRLLRKRVPDNIKAKLTLLYWGSPDEQRIMEALLDDYRSTHPDIIVEGLHASNYDSKLKTMLAAGTPPDLFYLKQSDVASFAKMKLLTNLQPHLNSFGPGYLDDFYPLLMDVFRFDGKRIGAGPLYALPKDFTTLVMYVNRDIFARAGVEVPYDGWTWDEYSEAMSKIAAINDKGKKYYGGVLSTESEQLRGIIWTYGGKFFGDSFTDLRISDAPAQNALDMIRRLRLEEKTVYNSTGMAQDGGQLFYTGKIGCIGPLGRWMTPRYRSIKSFEWDVVPAPHGVSRSMPIITTGWAVSKQTKNPEIACDLLKFLCGEKGQRLAARLGIAIPSRKNIAESPDFLTTGAAPEHSNVFLEALQTSKISQIPPEKEWKHIVHQELDNSIRLGSVSNREATSSIEQLWDKKINSPMNRSDYPAAPWVKFICIVLALFGVLFLVVLWLARKNKLGQMAASEERTGFLFISPWLIGFVLLTAGPMLFSLFLSFCRWTAMTPITNAGFVGFDNFYHLFVRDETFGQSLWVTTYYVILSVPLGQIVALCLALLINTRIPGIALFRTAYFVPSVVSGVALATLWAWMFNSDFGLVNNTLAPVLEIFGLSPPDWFGADANYWGVPAFVVMSMWGVGRAMIIYLAGLKGIPQHLYESARIDGAGGVKQFFAITLPMLSPLLIYNFIMSIIGCFQVFTQAYVMTSGGPANATLFYVLNLYRQAFEFNNMGYASAMAWVLFVIILLLTLLVFRTSKSWVYYEGLKK